MTKTQLKNLKIRALKALIAKINKILPKGRKI